MSRLKHGNLKMVMAVSCSILDVHNAEALSRAARDSPCLFRPYPGRVGRTVPVSREHATVMENGRAGLSSLPPSRSPRFGGPVGEGRSQPGGVASAEQSQSGRQNGGSTAGQGCPALPRKKLPPLAVQFTAGNYESFVFGLRK